MRIDHGGWLQPTCDGEPRVLTRAIHPSRYHSGYLMPTVDHGPDRILAHFTATGPGTAEVMARKRQKSRLRAPLVRNSSWHITLPMHEFFIVQMVPFNRGAYHAGNGPWNRKGVGVEFEGYGDFTENQVQLALIVWPLLVCHYAIEEAKAFVGHSEVKQGNSDPGPRWYSDIVPRLRQAVVF